MDKCIDDEECKITFPETKTVTDPLNKEYCDISKAAQTFTILVDAYDDTSTYDTCYFNEESINDYKNEANNEPHDLYYLNSVWKQLNAHQTVFDDIDVLNQGMFRLVGSGSTKNFRIGDVSFSILHLPRCLIRHRERDIARSVKDPTAMSGE